MSDKYWCDDCDARLVHEDDISTGKFFYRGGHIVYNDEPFEGRYVVVKYAICIHCLPTSTHRE